MTAPVRIAVFLAGLVVLFGVGYGIGTIAGPLS
jgi:hypothetical protein